MAQAPKRKSEGPAQPAELGLALWRVIRIVRHMAVMDQITRDRLRTYLDEVVDPTFEDFRRNPRSIRHAFLACVATYHAIDRVKPGHPGNLTYQWGKTLEFKIVDMVAHQFKHVRSGDDKHVSADSISLSWCVFPKAYQKTPGVESIDDSGIELHHMHFVIRDAIAFIRRQSD